MEYTIEMFRYSLNQNVGAEAETGVIGPDFNSKHFSGMIKRVMESSWQKRCKKISGDDDGFAKVEKAFEESEACFKSYTGYDEFETSYNQSQTTGDFKPMFKT